MNKRQDSCTRLPRESAARYCFQAVRLMLAASLLAGAPTVTAETAAPSSFKRWLSDARNNSRIALDFSNRDLYYTQGNEWGTQNVIGLDLFKVFSTSTRDVGTLVAQAYLTRIDNVQGHPGFFDDSHDTELVYRIFNFNFTGLPGKAPNIRIGHMEIPFGLEQTIDTNGTLRQYAVPRNLGLKADWGISLNQQHEKFEYEAAVTTGGVQSIRRRDDSFTVSGRIGSNRDANRVVGLSIYRSKLGGITRERVGLDLQSYFGRYGVFGELSLGNNNGEKVRNYLAEVNIRSRRDSWLFYLQSNHLSSRDSGAWNRTTLGTAGVRYTPAQKMSFSAQIGRTLKSPSGKNPSTVSVQARYRFIR